MNSKKITKQLTVISGKGGTGKSSIIASLAYILKDKIILADADVDAADLYLIFEIKFWIGLRITKLPSVSIGSPQWMLVSELSTGW